MSETNGKGLIGWHSSRWEKYLHDVRSQDGSWLGDAESAVGEAAIGALLPSLADDAGEGELELLTEACHAAAQHLGRGLYGHLYGEPERMDKGPAWAQAAVEALEKVAGLQDARDSVRGDPDMAAIAGSVLLKGVAREIPKLIERLQEQEADPQQDPAQAASEGEGGQEGGDGGEGTPSGDGAAQGAPGAPAGMTKEQLLAAIEASAKRSASALRATVQAAVAKVAEGRSLLNGVLPGLGEAPLRQEQESTGRLDLIERLKKDPRLTRILMIAGRIRRIAERVQHQRSDEVAEEVVDVEQGADLPRVLPSELMGLEDDTLEMLFFKDFAERSLSQYRLEGKEPLGKGAIACLIDISTSMDAPLNDGLRRIDWASAVGVAALRAGVEQKRKVVVILFNAYVARQWVVEIGDREGAKQAILEVAGIGVSGGTEFSPAIARALDLGAEKDRSDLVLVTDGFGGVSQPVQDRLAASRKRGLRCWGVICGAGGMPDAMKDYTDGVAVLDGSSDAAEVIGRLGAT